MDVRVFAIEERARKKSNRDESAYLVLLYLEVDCT